MKILVFGNVGSGKTTVLKQLHEKMPFEVIAIDDFRRKFGTGSKESELKARRKYFEAIQENKDQFIECIGLGEVADELFNLLSKTNEPVICLTLIAPKEICLSRLEKRHWDIPFHKPLTDVSSLIERTEIKISENEISHKWSKRSNTIIIAKRNIKKNDVSVIVSGLISFIEGNNLKSLKLSEIDIMLNKSAQNYYGNEYLSYQKKVIETNSKSFDDYLMISNFISNLSIEPNIVDIGSGNCRWFGLFEDKIEHYYAVEANLNALSDAPKSKKLSSYNTSVFDDQFNLKKVISKKNYCVFLSFFISHFSDKNINLLLGKLRNANEIIIIDSFWSSMHKERYVTKNLKNVYRKLSESESVILPKRFFDYSDIESYIQPFGYSISEFNQGYYWFVAFCKKISK